MSLYAIWDNLYSFVVIIKVNQNLKFLHWAAIVIGNRPVSALQALLLQCKGKGFGVGEGGGGRVELNK